MNVEFNKVTDLSKFLTVVILIGLVPVLVFYIGREYQKTSAINDEENYVAVNGSLAATSTYSRRESKEKGPSLYSSGIKGIAMVGPTCPTVSQGNEIECSDKPLSTIIGFVSSIGTTYSTTSAANGSFLIDLPPGTYTIVQGGAGLLPALTPMKVNVNEDEFINVTLNFDSGIR
jgi:hypothetical protein